MHGHTLLPAVQCRGDEQPEFIDLGVRHGEAADRSASAMDHQVRPGPVMRPVQIIGVSEIERAMVMAVWIELAFADRVKTFRRLEIALAHFRFELARPGANGIGREQLGMIAALQPEFHLKVTLEDAQQHRRAAFQSLLFEPLLDLGGVGSLVAETPEKKLR